MIEIIEENKEEKEKKRAVSHDCIVSYDDIFYDINDNRRYPIDGLFVLNCKDESMLFYDGKLIDLNKNINAEFISSIDKGYEKELVLNFWYKHSNQLRLNEKRKIHNNKATIFANKIKMTKDGEQLFFLKQRYYRVIQRIKNTKMSKYCYIKKRNNENDIIIRDKLSLKIMEYDFKVQKYQLEKFMIETNVNKMTKRLGIGSIKKINWEKLINLSEVVDI